MEREDYIYAIQSEVKAKGNQTYTFGEKASVTLTSGNRYSLVCMFNNYGDANLIVNDGCVGDCEIGLRVLDDDSLEFIYDNFIGMKRAQVGKIINQELAPLISDTFDRNAIIDVILDDVYHDVNETADLENWHNGDVRAAIVRVLKKRLGCYE